MLCCVTRFNDSKYFRNIGKRIYLSLIASQVCSNEYEASLNCLKNLPQLGKTFFPESPKIVERKISSCKKFQN